MNLLKKHDKKSTNNWFQGIEVGQKKELVNDGANQNEELKNIK